MSDNLKELLELAVKAAGIDPRRLPHAWPDRFDDDIWSPHIDDGDALRLANLLRINIQRETLMTDPSYPPSINCGQCGLADTGWAEEPEGDDPDAATRLAILRAAAAIGKIMP